MSQFRAYLENVDKTVPAVATLAPGAPPVTPPAGDGAPAVAPESASTAATAIPVPPSAPSVVTRQPAKYTPPFDIIGKAKTYTIRGKGPAGKESTFEHALGVGKYSDLQSAMGDIYHQMTDWGRMEYVEEVPKADLVILVYQ